MPFLETSLDRWPWRWALGWIVFWSMLCVLTPIEVGFDVAHYHIHDGWSALNGRLTRDLAPAGMHSYFNPLGSMITYAMIAALPAAAVTFLLGAIQAAVLIPLYLLCRRVLQSIGHDNRVSSLMLALAGYFNYAMLTMTSSVRLDHWVAAPFVIGLLFLAPKAGVAVTWRRAGLAAFVVGLSAGLKLTSVVYVAGIAAAILVAVPGIRARIEAVIAAGIAGLAGILLTGGWWMWKLWITVGNPVFPMGNKLFHSPYGPIANYSDVRGLPRSIWDILFFPFNAPFRPYNEFGKTWMQDLPIGLLYAAILMLAVQGFRAWRAGSGREVRLPSRTVLMLMAGAAGTLAVWFPMFMVGRYAMAIWMVSPLCFAAMLIVAWPAMGEARRALYWLSCVLVVCVVSANVVLTRRVPVKHLWGDYIEVEAPASIDFEHATVIFTGPYPSAFMAAYLPDTATFTFSQTPDWAEPAELVLRQMVRQRIDETDGPFVAVILDAGSHDGDDSLPVIMSRLREQLGLVADPGTCADFRTSLDTAAEHWIACPLTKAG